MAESTGHLLVSSDQNTTVWITNGLHRRHVKMGTSDEDMCRTICGFQVCALEVTNAELAHVPIVGATNANSNPAYDPSL